MAVQKIKTSDFAKNFGLKTKDVNDYYGKASKDPAAKAPTMMEAEAIDLLLNVMTRENQITGMLDYLDGKTFIPKPKKEEKQAEKPVEKPAEKPAEKPTEKTAEPTEKTVSAPKTEQKPAETVKPAAPANDAGKGKTAEAPKQSVSPEKPQPSRAPQAQQPNVNRPAQSAQPNPNQRPAAGMPGTNGGIRPQGQNGQPRPQGPNGAPRPQGQNGQNGGIRPQGPNGAPRPQGQNGQNGAFRPTGQTGQGRPQGPNGPFRPGQPRTPGPNVGRSPFAKDPNAGFDKKDGFSNLQERAKGGSKPSPQPPRGQIDDKDGGSTRLGGHKDVFKAGDYQRGAATRGGQVLVDLSGNNTDVRSYDDRYYGDMGDVRGGTQRIKKNPQSQQGQQNQSKNARAMGKKGQKGKGAAPQKPVTVRPTAVVLPDEIMVSDLASKLMVTTGEVVKKLISLGMMVNATATIDFDTAAIVADEMGVSATKEVVVTLEEKVFAEEADSDENLVARAPVVCVMGHVDHGKTSILDAIRHTNVTRGEAGGITQHIGAYRVNVNGQPITFLDTPGHEAFTAMRARGAMATDIAILVVAADDGIMPQTIEAINHAKAAGVDIIVAINKMDKPTANPDQVKQELTKYDLVPEEWGGDVICVPVSALTGMGIDNLLESVLLVAEVKELKANPNRRAKGLVIEAKLDKGRGPVATVLVQNGTLHSGDIVIAGTAVGRVRAMQDHNGKLLKEAGPSVPVELVGLSDVPQSGDEFNAVEDERMARELADRRRATAKEEVFKANARANLNDLFDRIAEGVKELNVIIKADVGGSAEAVRQSLEKISNDEVKVNVIHAATGGIIESDVMLAEASNAIIVGFGVRPDKAALDRAERQGVEIRTYRVIYDCINEIKDALRGMLAPVYKEELQGHVEVRQTIHVPNVGMVAGSYVLDGKITRASKIRVVRDGIVIFGEDKVASLRRFKDDVREVAAGYECGVTLERFSDVKVGDVLEAFVMEEVEREL